MLQLKEITKTYGEKSDSAVKALKGVSLNFRPCEFVSILGQSGCGKTTMLNIIGGLDRYTDGDLIINGTSTKLYKDKDWDTYRNHSIGFVFQSYNLIPHLTILENVELSMTIGGVDKADRKKRAKEALIAVGLEAKLNKRPNQLSGGQMQRVSIARALVNEPDIILADEPTGALDSETSVQVMEVLKNISKTKLVIMVTHNPELAEKYSDRIIRMLDGNVVDDSNPYDGEDIITKDIQEQSTDVVSSGDGKTLKYKKKHASMSFFTALRLSAKNLLSKKKRTIITSLAASIGLIGIAVILSVSSGMEAYINKTMMNSASFNYVAISSTTTIRDHSRPNNSQESLKEYPENTTGIYPYEKKTAVVRKQKLDSEFISYLEEKTKGIVVDITYSYSVDLNILTKKKDGTIVNVNSANWDEALNNIDYLSQNYTVLAKDESAKSGIPTEANEISLVVDKYNRLSTATLDALGIDYDADNLAQIDYTNLIGMEFRVVFNDGWYMPDATGSLYSPANVTNYDVAYASPKGITVKVISVLRENRDISASWLSEGVAYSPALTQKVLEENKNSAVALAQFESKKIDVTTGKEFSPNISGLPPEMLEALGIAPKTYESALEKLGYTQTPTSIFIYPTNVENRKLVTKYLDAWNEVNGGTDKEIAYIDMSSAIMSMLNSIVETVTYVLVAFSITSLVISSIMIAIIIYASVIERTKEIGVLRSIGARKRDISHVFEAEAMIIGLVSGIVAILITLIVNVIINAILGSLVGVTTIASLPVLTAFGLILLSVVLLLLASLIPARIAAKKEPAVALRTE